MAEANALVPASEAQALAALDEARRQIGLAKASGDVDALKEWRDRAAAVQHYARQRAGAKDIANDAGEVKVRAEAALGALDEAMAPRGRPAKDSAAEGFLAGEVAPETRAAWRKLGKLDEPTLDGYIERAREDEQTGVSTARIADLIKTDQREQRRDEKRQRTSDLAAVEVPPLLTAYSVLCADPPWRYEANTTPDTRAIENHYPTMSAGELAALPVPADDDAVLFLWATSPKLAEALELLAAWRFEYRTCMVWVKDRIGMGHYARQRHELLLIARRGSLPVPDPQDRPDSVIEAPRLEHSRKPDEAYARIERMYPHLPRVELFARSPRPGWAVWGNEAREAA
jgi:N6-adenosine-specific RNA methylase IME4